MKKILCAIIAALMLVILCVPAFADKGGETSSDFSYEYDEETGRLVIKGQGELLISSASLKAEGIEPKSLVIEEGITAIPAFAFSDMLSLEAITLPHSIENVGVHAFYNTYYYNHPQNRVNGVLYIGNVLIDALPSISRSYSVKEGTKCIADDAFFGCDGLVSLTLPEGVTHIGSNAFYRCTSLKRLTLPSTIKNIDRGATNYADSLESVIYKGTPDKFACISVLDGNDALRCAKLIFEPEAESDTEPQNEDAKKPAGLLGGCAELFPGAAATAVAFALAAAFAVIKKK